MHLLVARPCPSAHRYPCSNHHHPYFSCPLRSNYPLLSLHPCPHCHQVCPLIRLLYARCISPAVSATSSTAMSPASFDFSLLSLCISSCKLVTICFRWSI